MVWCPDVCITVSFRRTNSFYWRFDPNNSGTICKTVSQNSVWKCSVNLQFLSFNIFTFDIYKMQWHPLKIIHSEVYPECSLAVQNLKCYFCKGIEPQVISGVPGSTRDMTKYVFVIQMKQPFNITPGLVAHLQQPGFSVTSSSLSPVFCLSSAVTFQMKT